jgi:predicted phage tail component-like protein
MDMDFLGFTFNGKHSYLDLGVLRTINDRIQHSLSPEMNDITADNPGGDGTYYFGSRHKSRKFSVDFAFDHLNEQQMREWKRFCSNKELSDLIFDEEPYKVYTAKITGAPILKTIPFDENGERIYKGEGTLEFTCYWPYAHTPDENTKVSTKLLADGAFGADGKVLSSYPEVLYPTKNQWAQVSGINIHTPGNNFGDMPAPFVYSTTTTLDANDTITIGDLTIKVL